MTQKEAESMKDLARSTVEALDVVTERECPECYKLNTYIPKTVDTPYGRLAGMDECSKCSGTGKVRWKWELKVGEWCIFLGGKKQEITLITNYIKSDPLYAYIKHAVWMQVERLIPILSWEEIERVLERVGYYLQINKPLDVYIKKREMKVRCSIYQIGRDDFMVFAQAKSRQEAVMRAVIALAKEFTRT